MLPKPPAIAAGGAVAPLTTICRHQTTGAIVPKAAPIVVVAFLLLALFACSPHADQPDASGPRDGASDTEIDAPEADIYEVYDTISTDDTSSDVASDRDAADTRDDVDPSDVESDSGEPNFEEGAPPVGDSRVRPGVGQQQLETLHQGDTVRWERGPQGGYHVWVGVRVDNTLLSDLDEEERDSTYHRYRLERADGTLLASTQRLGALQREGDVWLALGQYAVLEAPVRPTTLDGEALLYRVEVERPSRAPVSSQVWVRSACCD